MKGRELERLLEVADEVAELEVKLRRLQALQDELEREREIARLAPEVARAAADRVRHIEAITRALEEEWVAQGPLVSLWQRAVELAELAESSGADPEPYQAEVDEARRRVESARLKTRDFLDQLVEEREALMDIALAAPFELPTAEPVKDDLRPEAARREALALAEFAGEICRRAQLARQEAVQRVEDLLREIDELGSAELIRSRIAELRLQLPARVELPRSAPPSAARRLQRAGVAVDSPTAV
jgi:hypothetical protein